MLHITLINEEPRVFSFMIEDTIKDRFYGSPENYKTYKAARTAARLMKEELRKENGYERKD